MKVLFKWLIATVLLCNMTACSWLFGEDGYFRNRSSDYRKARVEPALELPANIDSDALDDSYAIPVINDRTALSKEFEVPRPEPLDEEVNRDSVRINILGSTRWILVNGSPGQVWPRLRGFLSLNQLPVQRADASTGILETAWLQPKGDGLLPERYRLRIEQGVQRATSEVYVLQADSRSGQDQWPAASSDVEREKIMVRELAQYLADSSAAAAVSMLAEQAIDASGRITLKEDDPSHPYLQLGLPFSRAWASVGNALEKARFTVDDLNRDQRIYYVHYREGSGDDEEKPGFFRSLFSSRKKALGEAYYLYVREKDSQAVLITIERQDGEAMDQGAASNLLKRIKKHLS